MKTKIHELLGVDIDEVFTVNLLGEWYGRYKISSNGALFEEIADGLWSEVRSSRRLADLINGTFEITRTTKPTSKQLEILKALNTLGFERVGQEQSGRIFAYKLEPLLRQPSWLFSYRLDELRSLIPDGIETLDVKGVLGK